MTADPWISLIPDASGNPSEITDLDECPAGGPHTPTNDSSHPDRLTDPYWHCDECNCSLPTPQRDDY